MISIVIQAGGESQRMGQDKALMPFLGKTLLERVIERVSDLGNELLVTTNHPEKFSHFKIPLFQDRQPERGALGGLFTALSAAQFPTVIVVACDMPFVNPDILKVACEWLSTKEGDVVIPRTKYGYEPLHGVYRREICLPAVNRALTTGEKRMISWFPSVKVIPLTEGELVKYDPMGIAFWNVNTLEELRRAEDMAREHGE
jgi:molybdopterin-guanine dinucleotide biosynthesis protein A